MRKLFRTLKSASGCSQFTKTTDEINRAPPKTQAALLQAMSERMVTIDGTVKARADVAVNANLPTGEIEVFASRDL